MPLFHMWKHALCESLLWVTHLAFCEALPSVRPGLPWDPGFCEALPSVRPWPLWGFAFCETLTLFILWYPAFCETLPLFNGLCLLWSRAFVWDHLWDLAFRETLASVRPCCETLASVRPCLLWDPSFSETLALFILWYPAFWETRLCLMGETLSSVKPCLSVRPCLPWCVRPCRLFNLYRKMCYMSIDCILLLS